MYISAYSRKGKTSSQKYMLTSITNLSNTVFRKLILFTDNGQQPLSLIMYVLHLTVFTDDDSVLF